MKFCSSSKMVVLALTLLLAASALAGENHKASMQVLNPVQVNGKQLQAGDYQLQWQGSGPNVELSISRGKAVLVTVPARVLELNDKTANDAVVVSKNDDGSRSLTEIRLAGKKFALALGNESAEMKSGNSSK